MFPPDRMISHNLSPRCHGGTELCAYMDREWAATPAYLGDGGGGSEPTRVEGRTTGLLARLSRTSRSRIRIPFL